MFDHLEFSVGDIVAARRFYIPTCTAIGAKEMFFDEDAGELGIGTGQMVNFLIMQGQPTAPKMHIGFQAQNKTSVDAAHAGALAGGGRCNGKPGYRPHYAPGYYAAFIIDPEGHNVEILFRDPSPTAEGQGARQGAKNR